MFFEFEDIKKRRQPTWGLNNTTGFHSAVDSTPSWNYQRGIMIGFTTHLFQQYLSSFIDHAKVMGKYYEPPTNIQQAWQWFKSTKSLQSFRANAINRRQIAAYGAFFDIGLKLASFRQFNSGWQANFGGFQYSYYRKIPSFLFSFLVASPFAVAGEMAQRAFVADSTFPKQLQKGYKSYFDALRRIPFEQGPYYLLKNTFPLFVKHILGPFTAFYTYDWLKDKLSVLWRTSSSPMLPVQLSCATFATYLGVVFTYPFAHTSRMMVDFWPKKDGVDPFNGNYRRASVWLWYGPTWNISFPGLFKSYFWKVFPLWWTSILLADKFGMFSYWRIDIMSGASDNTPDDSFI